MRGRGGDGAEMGGLEERFTGFEGKGLIEQGDDGGGGAEAVQDGFVEGGFGGALGR